MPQPFPEFTTKPIGQEAKNEAAMSASAPQKKPLAANNEPPAKPARRKKNHLAAKAKTKKIKSDDKEAEFKSSTEKLIHSASQAALSQSLNTIYQNEQGELPNMKEIIIKKTHPAIKFFSTLIIIGALLSAAAWAGFYFISGPSSFSSDSITVKITGPTEVELGTVNTYEVSYLNDQNQTLQNAVLQIQYPAGFVYQASSLSADNAGHTEWRLNNIPAHGQGSFSITGISYGSLGQTQAWRVLLNYKPQNINSSLQQVGQLQTKIASSPLTLTVAGPDKAEAGVPVNYSFVVKNSGEWNIPQLDLLPNLAANFKVVSSTPNLAKNRWLVYSNAASTTVSTSPEMTFVLTGVWNNASGTEAAPLGASLQAVIGQLKQNFLVAATNVTTTLVKNGINFNLAINGSLTNFTASPGNLLIISLRLLNASEQTLKNGSIELNLEAPSIKKQSLLNWAELKDENNAAVQGMQKSENRRLGQTVWTYKEVNALAKIKPGQEINLDLQLPIKNSDSFEINSLSETVINATAAATFIGVNGAQTINANPVNITLGSDLKLETRDTIKTVGSGETHQITWVLNNTFHALKDLTVTAQAFGDVGFAAEPTPAGAVTFDNKEKIISWKINEMPEGIDVLALPFTLTLNSKNPTQNTLLSKTKVTATDSVTNETINLTGDEILLNQ